MKENMKNTLILIVTMILVSQAFCGSYRIQLSSKDRIKVSAPSDWSLEQTEYTKKQKALFIVRPEDKSFIMKLYFLRDNGTLSTPEKIKKRMLADGEEFLKSSVETKVEINEFDLKDSYGFYATYTDKKTASNPNPKPTDYLYMTRGNIRLSDDSVLAFWVVTHEIDDDVFKQCVEYLTGYIQ